VMILRHTRPDLPRGFKVPFYPILPLLSVASCIYLVCNLSPATFVLFAVWLALASVFYFAYSMRHSRLEAAPQQRLTFPERRVGAVLTPVPAVPDDRSQMDSAGRGNPR
jgi:amino acid transporter